VGRGSGLGGWRVADEMAQRLVLRVVQVELEDAGVVELRIGGPVGVFRGPQYLDERVHHLVVVLPGGRIEVEELLGVAAGQKTFPVLRGWRGVCGC